MTLSLICKLQLIATKQLQLDALSKRIAKLSNELMHTLKEAEL